MSERYFHLGDDGSGRICRCQPPTLSALSRQGPVHHRNQPVDDSQNRPGPVWITTTQKHRNTPSSPSFGLYSTAYTHRHTDTAGERTFNRRHDAVKTGPHPCTCVALPWEVKVPKNIPIGYYYRSHVPYVFTQAAEDNLKWYHCALDWDGLRSTYILSYTMLLAHVVTLVAPALLYIYVFYESHL